MRVRTKRFGVIDVKEELIITFNEGIPGFKDCKEFLLLTRDENEDEEQEQEREYGSKEVFFWLQSVDDGDVAFALMDIFEIMPEYRPAISEEDIENLGAGVGFEEGEYREEDFIVYNVAVIPKDVTQTRVNLKAPIIINIVSRKGKQVILDNNEYSVRYFINSEFAGNTSLNTMVY